MVEENGGRGFGCGRSVHRQSKFLATLPFARLGISTLTLQASLVTPCDD